MALLPTEQEIIGADVTNAQQKTRFAAIRQFIQDLLGTDSNDKAAARASLGVGLGPRVSGLRGNVNAATPLTKFDLSADMVTLRDANGGTVTRYNTGALTCDLGLSGPAANGRDQAGAFPANSWVNLFLIWNGTTLATITSTKAHTAGPTLPAGYTHWCYATTLRWSASSSIVPGLIRGCAFFYDGTTETRALTAGSSTTYVPVSLANYVPPAASVAIINFLLSYSRSTTGNMIMNVRPTGVAGNPVVVVRGSVQVVGMLDEASNTMDTPLGISQQIDYSLAPVAPSGFGAYIDVVGYKVPNGDC